jgi:hypothetical protein
MNNLLLLIVLVLIICLVNNKDLMKSVSSKAKSMNMDDTTLLIIAFVVVVLFMCMSKKVEGFTKQNNGVCANGDTEMHLYDPNGDKNKHVKICISPEQLNIFDELLMELGDIPKKVITKLTPTTNLSAEEPELSPEPDSDRQTAPSGSPGPTAPSGSPGPTSPSD